MEFSKYIFYNIGAIIFIGWEIQRLLYDGFFVSTRIWLNEQGIGPFGKYFILEPKFDNKFRVAQKTSSITKWKKCFCPWFLVTEANIILKQLFIWVD